MSELDGKPIINLPTREVIMDANVFTPEEKEFYRALEQKQRLQFNKYLRAGTVMSNYANVLVLLLRLRQACCHPSLLTCNFEEGPPVNEDAEKQAVLASIPEDVQMRLLENDGMSFDCPICFDQPTECLLISHCGHLFCRECIIGYLAAEDAGPGKVIEKACPSCRHRFSRSDLVSSHDFLHYFAPEKVPPKVIAPKIEKVVLQRSTKITRTLEILAKSRASNPSDKTIIFSQWTMMLDVVQHMLLSNDIKFLRFDGSMTSQQKESTLNTYRAQPDIPILLVSLKCGSVGLNLTCANRIILLDVWWNPAIENQAIDRVHRFGQEKPVYVHRLTISETVEDRILTLQAQKQKIIDDVLDEKTGGGAAGNMRLGLQDLIHLFGHDQEDVL